MKMIVTKLLKFTFVLVIVLYALCMTLFSTFATAVSATLSSIGITSASAELLADLKTIKLQNKSLSDDISSTKKNLANYVDENKKLVAEAKSLKIQNSSLADEVKSGRAATKNMQTKINKLADELASSKKLATASARQAANLTNQLNRATVTNNANKLKNIELLHKKIARRGVRLLALNGGTVGADVAIGWIPYASLAVGGAAVAWELVEICGQLDDLDRLAEISGGGKHDRGKFAYLCGESDKRILNFSVRKMSPDEVPSEVRQAYENYRDDKVADVPIDEMRLADIPILNKDYTLINDRYIVEGDLISADDWFLVNGDEAFENIGFYQVQRIKFEDVPPEIKTSYSRYEDTGKYYLYDVDEMEDFDNRLRRKNYARINQYIVERDLLSSDDWYVVLNQEYADACNSSLETYAKCVSRISTKD
jgi:regulator of replication initiation timing